MFDFIKTILQRKDVYNQGNDIIQEEDMFVPSSYLDGIYTQTKEDALFNNRILNITQSNWDDGGIYSKDYATSMILKTNNFQMGSGNMSNKTNFFILDSDTIKATSYTENNDVFYTLNTIPLKAGVGIDITDNTINFTGDMTTEIVVAKPNEFIVDYLEENMDNAIDAVNENKSLILRIGEKIKTHIYEFEKIQNANGEHYRWSKLRGILNNTINVIEYNYESWKTGSEKWSINTNTIPLNQKDIVFVDITSTYLHINVLKENQKYVILRLTNNDIITYAPIYSYQTNKIEFFEQRENGYIIHTINNNNNWDHVYFDYKSNDIYNVEYNVTTYADALTAYTEDKYLTLYKVEVEGTLLEANTSNFSYANNSFVFRVDLGDKYINYTLNSSGWSKSGQIDRGGNVLPVASDTDLGGVKIGSGLSIDEDGVVSTIGGGDGNGVVTFILEGEVIRINEEGEYMFNGGGTTSTLSDNVYSYGDNFLGRLWDEIENGNEQIVIKSTKSNRIYYLSRVVERIASYGYNARYNVEFISVDLEKGGEVSTLYLEDQAFMGNYWIRSNTYYLNWGKIVGLDGNWNKHYLFGYNNNILLPEQNNGRPVVGNKLVIGDQNLIGDTARLAIGSYNNPTGYESMAIGYNNNGSGTLIGYGNNSNVGKDDGSTYLPPILIGGNLSAVPKIFNDGVQESQIALGYYNSPSEDLYFMIGKPRLVNDPLLGGYIANPHNIFEITHEGEVRANNFKSIDGNVSLSNLIPFDISSSDDSVTIEEDINWNYIPDENNPEFNVHARKLYDIKVNTETLQGKLTAGAGISIEDGVVSTKDIPGGRLSTMHECLVNTNTTNYGGGDCYIPYDFTWGGVGDYDVDNITYLMKRTAEASGQISKARFFINSKIDSVALNISNSKCGFRIIVMDLDLNVLGSSNFYIYDSKNEVCNMDRGHCFIAQTPYVSSNNDFMVRFNNDGGEIFWNEEDHVYDYERPPNYDYHGIGSYEINIYEESEGSLVLKSGEQYLIQVTTFGIYCAGLDKSINFSNMFDHVCSHNLMIERTKTGTITQDTLESMVIADKIPLVQFY